MGGWTHSDDASLDGETTFNLQTRSLFIDMRIPKEGAALLEHHQGFDTMTVRMMCLRGGGGGLGHVLMVLSLREEGTEKERGRE